MDDVQSPGHRPPQPQPQRPPQPQLWRWAAHPPFGAPGAPPHPAQVAELRRRAAESERFRAETDRSPRYRAIPRWGLPRVVAPGRAEGTGSGGGVPVDVAHADHAATAAARLLERLLGVLVWLGVVAGVIGWIRYGLLVALRGSVVHFAIEWVSAGAVYLAYAAVGVTSLASVVALARWLVAERAAALTPGRDFRSPAAVWAMVLVPLVNALCLPLLLRELELQRPVAPKVHMWARRGWILLCLGELVGLAYWTQILGHGAQAQANALSLGALLAVLGAAAAWCVRRALRVARNPRPMRRYIYVGPVARSESSRTEDGTATGEPTKVATSI